jgi:hypothetical protein
MFEDIANVHPERRRRIIRNKAKFQEEEQTNFPERDIPGLFGLEVSSQLDKNTNDIFYRRQTAFFGEVKWDDSEANISDIVNPVTRQAASYAIQVFSGRPFNVFVIGLVICGDEFRIALFDKGGVSYSDSHKLGSDFFIKVIYLMTTDMNDHQLGLASTVSLAPNCTWYSPTYPSFVVSYGGANIPYTVSTVRTQGAPLWVSLSLLGRGSSVWKTDSKSILKFAWRKEKRLSEASIYEKLAKGARGIAEYKFGSDVYLNNTPAAVKLSVNRLRSDLRIPPHHQVADDQNSVLHCIELASVGKPLSSYDKKNIKHLCRGLKDILAGE